MAQPPAKKQKLDDTNSPIVFSQPGLKPDTRLTVFDQEFHVHSIILKLKSAFFRKFLDSPDKALTNETIANTGSGQVPTTSSVAPASAPNSTSETITGWKGVEFKYDWISKVDADGWHLVTRQSRNEPYAMDTYNDHKDFQEGAFQKLLCAIYNLPYTLLHTAEFTLIFELADYYCALPSLSRTLDGCLMNDLAFCKTTRYEADELFLIAAKLRNALLFRECLIWVVGPHNRPIFHTEQDQRLRMIARCVHGEIISKIMQVDQLLTIWLFNGDTGNEPAIELEALDQLELCDLTSTEFSVPCLFRILSKGGNALCDGATTKELLKNNLKLDRTRMDSGQADFELQGHFLCAEIADEDLPWDVNEMDW